MSTQIKLPNLGENIESGDVLSIMVQEGDAVAKDQDLLEIETDKATLPIPSPESGTVTRILVSEGDTVVVGAPLFEMESIESAGAASVVPESKAPESKAPEPVASEPEVQEVIPAPSPAAAEAVAPMSAPASPPVSTPVVDAPVGVEGDVPGDGHSSAAAGPAVRRLARQLGVDLRWVRPTGEAGRITADDVQAHVRSSNQQTIEAQSASVTPPGTPDSDGQGAVRVEKMSRMRQTIARNMLESYTTIPQLTNFDDVDITELEEIRQQSKGDYAAQGLKLTHMPFLIKAIASSLRLHPIVNASVDMENKQIIYKEYVNIGIAVDTDRGLVVPVMRDADRLSISQITKKLAELAAMARDGSFGVDDLRGGTFTISNLGAVGGTYSTPIINPPEVAILLVGRSRMMPQFIGDQGEGHFEPRLVMPLSITYDHRVVDGAAAARFLNDVKGFLAAPGRLLMAP